MVIKILVVKSNGNGSLGRSRRGIVMTITMQKKKEFMDDNQLPLWTPADDHFLLNTHILVVNVQEKNT